MGKYSGLFDYGGTPHLEEENRNVWKDRTALAGGSYVSHQTRNVVSSERSKEEQKAFDKRSSEFDSIMRGYDENTAALTDKLRGIYDNYSKNADQFGEDMQPIMDAIGADIGQLQTWMGGYDELLAEMRPDMMSGINVESSPKMRRAEYMGAVGGQYKAAEESMRRRMSSQGLNPYANTGATREFGLERAGAMAGASNKAYSDWHEQRNRDVERQNQGRSDFAGLYSKTGDNLNNVMKARGGLAGMYGDIYNVGLEGEKATAGGYEGLVGLNENRRSEALKLEQANAQQRQSNALTGSNMQANLGVKGEWKHTGRGI